MEERIMEHALNALELANAAIDRINNHKLLVQINPDITITTQSYLDYACGILEVSNCNIVVDTLVALKNLVVRIIKYIWRWLTGVKDEFHSYYKTFIKATHQILTEPDRLSSIDFQSCEIPAPRPADVIKMLDAVSVMNVEKMSKFNGYSVNEMFPVEVLLPFGVTYDDNKLTEVPTDYPNVPLGDRGWTIEYFVSTITACVKVIEVFRDNIASAKKLSPASLASDNESEISKTAVTLTRINIINVALKSVLDKLFSTMEIILDNAIKVEVK